jgi:hypothetical protein
MIVFEALLDFRALVSLVRLLASDDNIGTGIRQLGVWRCPRVVKNLATK